MLYWALAANTHGPTRQPTNRDFRAMADISIHLQTAANIIVKRREFLSTRNSPTRLQKICDSEINVRIGWVWDCGIEIRLGDDMNGNLADETVSTVAEIVPWSQEAIAHF